MIHQNIFQPIVQHECPIHFLIFFLRNFLWNKKKVSVALEIVDISSKSKVKSKWKITSKCSLFLLFPSIVFELQYCHIKMLYVTRTALLHRGVLKVFSISENYLRHIFVHTYRNCKTQVY